MKGTEAGTYDMGLKPEDFTNNNENYGNVTFRVTDGQLTITPKTIDPEDEKSGIEARDPADSIPYHMYQILYPLLHHFH